MGVRSNRIDVWLVRLFLLDDFRVDVIAISLPLVSHLIDALDSIHGVVFLHLAFEAEVCGVHFLDVVWILVFAFILLRLRLSEDTNRPEIDILHIFLLPPLFFLVQLRVIVPLPLHLIMARLYPLRNRPWIVFLTVLCISDRQCLVLLMVYFLVFLFQRG